MVGHDYRSYSASIKAALINGLLAGGAEVHDIGLALSPMAYFAQFELGVEGVAMVTASHNDNGWTGIKMGIERPLTFAPDDMSALKSLVLEGALAPSGGGRYIFVPDMPERYMADLLKRPKLIRPLKAVVSCGNGTAGAFAPRVLAELGVDRRAAQLRARLYLPRAQSEPRRHRHAARHRATPCWSTAPISALPSTATATAAAWSTTRARRSSPTRSA